MTTKTPNTIEEIATEQEQQLRDIAETLASTGVCRYVRPNGTDCFCAELCQPCAFQDAIERLQNS